MSEVIKNIMQSMKILVEVIKKELDKPGDLSDYEKNPMEKDLIYYGKRNFRINKGKNSDLSEEGYKVLTHDKNDAELFVYKTGIFIEWKQDKYNYFIRFHDIIALNYYAFRGILKSTTAVYIEITTTQTVINICYAGKLVSAEKSKSEIELLLRILKDALNDFIIRSLIEKLKDLSNRVELIEKNLTATNHQNRDELLEKISLGELSWKKLNKERKNLLIKIICDSLTK